MAKRSNPFDELERLLDQMEANFEEAARWWEREPSATETTAVSIDLEDREDELVLTADLPGFDTDDIDVRVTDNTLHLEAEHEEATEEEEEGEYVRRERRRRSVARSVSLPAAVETDDISATYTNGVLRVQMPKSEPSSGGERIEIE